MDQRTQEHLTSQEQHLTFPDDDMYSAHARMHSGHAQPTLHAAFTPLHTVSESGDSPTSRVNLSTAGTATLCEAPSCRHPPKPCAQARCIGTRPKVADSSGARPHPTTVRMTP